MNLQLSVLLTLSMALLAGESSATDKLAEVPPADLSKLRLSDFRDDELDIPYYFAHFHRLANSVVMEGPERGFFSLPVWRPKQYNKPYNARVLENHLALAFFYCQDRPWNPYRGHPTVRERLEAVLDFWCRSQNDKGWFSEYGPQKWNLPATGFATMFMGGTLKLLHDGPPMDPQLMERTVTAQRKAMRALLTDDALFRAGMSCSNQYSGLWGGMLAFFEIHPDEELKTLMRKRLADSLLYHQSPVGYWYEAGGCDWPYTLRTHHGNLWMAWHFARGTDLEEPFVTGETRWADWVAYNSVREPDGTVLILNRAIETRSPGKNESRHNPIAEKVPMSRILSATDEEFRSLLVQKRKALTEAWPEVPDLEVGHDHAYSPHVLLNLTHRRWYPTKAERDAAIRQMPCFTAQPFNHHRVDHQRQQSYAFIRREAYYAAFNAGPSLTGNQRFGLGMIWSEKHGALLHSRSASRSESWGTRPDGEDNVFETSLTGAESSVNGQPVERMAGAGDLPRGDLSVSYPLREEGRKTVSFRDGRIDVAVQCNGAFSEQIPLLIPDGGRLEIADGRATLHNGETTLNVSFSPAAKANELRTGITVAGKTLRVLRILAQGKLDYRLEL